MAEKITFDIFTRIISVNPGVTSLDIKADVYSGWKRWALLADNNGIGRVVRSIGGDTTIGVFKAGDIYFLVNGWKLQIDLTETAITGSLFSDDFPSPLIDFTGKAVFQSFVSNLVSGVNQDTSTEMAQKVWELQRSLANLAGSFGEAVSRIHTRLDLNKDAPNKYSNDRSSIENADFTLTKTDNGDGTSTVQITE